MFRYTARRMGVFSMSRLPLRLEAKAQQGRAVNIQKVRFTKPKFGGRVRSFVLYAITIYTCVNIYDKLVLGPLDRGAEEALKNIPASELDGDVDKPIFIPFPGTAKIIESQPYRGSDPEWQAYVKISRDAPLQARLRAELTQYVKRMAESSPAIVAKCGKGMKVNRFWLDIMYPYFPPPEYERSGIEISDEAISWVTAPVDSHTVFKLQNVLYPLPLIQSCWDFAKILAKEDMKWVAGKLGIQSNNSPAPSLSDIVARNEGLFGRPALNKNGPPVNPGPSDGLTSAVGKTPKPAKFTSESKAPENDDTKLFDETRSALREHFLQPVLAFKKKLRQSWKPANNYPPRGSIILKGTVQLETPKSYVSFAVYAAWDPKTQQFAENCMYIVPKVFQVKNQSPGRR